MSKHLKGVGIESIAMMGTQVPAFVFSHSRVKQVMALLLVAVIFPLGAYWYLHPEEATPNMIPFIRVFGPAGTRLAGLAVMGVSLGGTVLAANTLRKRLTYLALAPTGIYYHGAKRVYFAPWAAIGAIAPFSWGPTSPQPFLGLRIQSPESVQAAVPMLPIMQANRSFSGWDLSFGLKAFQARPQFVEIAVQYYFHNPAQRPAIGTASELDNLASIVAAKWKPPQSHALRPPIPDPDSHF